jgi:transposase
VKWATDALDEVLREAWNDARRQARAEPRRGRGRPPTDAAPRPGSERAKGLKGARYSLWKNPEDVTENQRVMLAWIAATDPRLYRAYLAQGTSAGSARLSSSQPTLRGRGPWPEGSVIRAFDELLLLGF